MEAVSQLIEQDERLKQMVKGVDIYLSDENQTKSIEEYLEEANREFKVGLASRFMPKAKEEVFDKQSESSEQGYQKQLELHYILKNAPIEHGNMKKTALSNTELINMIRTSRQKREEAFEYIYNQLVYHYHQLYSY